MPVFPATQEAEAGGLHEPRSSRLRQATIAPLRFSLGDKVRLCLKRKKKRKEMWMLELLLVKTQKE